MNHKFGGAVYAHRKMKQVTQEQLADYFEVSTDELLGRSDCMVDANDLYTS